MSSSVSLPIALQGEHWSISAISLNAHTDENDTLVHRSEFQMYRGWVAEKMEGNIFFLENEHDGNAVVILTDCPDYERAEVKIFNYTATVHANTNAVTVIPCQKGKCEEACRQAYREGMGKKGLIAMSNTWGDGNGFSRVCEEFVIREIDRAAELGLNIIQIDDGWQFGNTADPARRDENGRRKFDDDFWQVNTDRFPKGLKYLSDYAAEKGIRVGLWFAPENRNQFACMERDIAILKNAYENWGIRFFKLDMYWIENDTDRDRFLQFLQAVYSFGSDVAVQLDVTCSDRINYLCGRQYGTIFVENRYTKTGSYFPHRTLKNLWTLARYIPSARFQYELVNPELHTDQYSPQDDFAPIRYDIDYLFASVMLSNPLFWMEIQHLSQKNVEKLQKILAFWKSQCTLFAECDVAPIGEIPTGRSFTGFYLRNGNEEYALLFREATENSTGVFCVPTEKNATEVLISNTEVSVKLEPGVLIADFSSSRAYALVKLV